MSKLIVKSNGQIVQELQIEAGRTYVVGRKQDADIVLNQEKGISREHFSIREEEGQVHVEVLSKFGGLKFKSDEVQKRVWNIHESLKLKIYEFILVADGESANAESRDQVEEYEAAESDSSSELADELEKTVVKKTTLTPLLKLIDVNGNEIESYDLLGGDTWIAGRDPVSSIVINDTKVSRRQFEIKKIEGRFAVIDLKSVNGTYVNGQPISSDSYTYLKSQDQINVLSNHYRFELYDKNLVKSLSEMKAPVVASSVLQVNQPLQPVLQPYSLQPHQGEQYPQQYQAGYQYPPSSYPQYQTSMPIPPVKTQFDVLKDRLFENKMRSGLVGLVLLLVVYYGYDSMFASAPVAPSRNPTSLKSDPLASLPPEKRRLIETSYRMAKTFYMNGKYELCKGELAKLGEYNITSYQDSQDLIHLCDEGISRQDQIRRLEQDEKMKVEMEQKIQQKVAECRPLALKTAVASELEQCLQGILDLNPDHVAIQELRAQVDQNRTQNLMQQQNRDRYAELSQRLRSMFGHAQATEAKGDMLEAIPLYQRVAKSDLPDSGNYKTEAKRKLASIQRDISSKTQSYLSAAEKHYQAGQMKQAILNLRNVRKIDPNNADVHERIDSYENQLTKKMKEIYEESVVEESYGNVLGTDGKDGAVEKWKKIIKLDVPGNEYFEKARKKLRMYKAL